MNELVESRQPVEMGLWIAPESKEERAELIKIIHKTVYPTYEISHVAMVFNYCRSFYIDPMTRPFHIVKMGNSYAVIPSINLYRTIAHRTGKYAGIDEPEFGEEIDYKGVKSPSWCKISVYRIVSGVKCKFTSIERLEENIKSYGNKVGDFWAKRPYGQLAKCAEAQALRKAFGLEMTGLPTVEELIGQELYEREFGTKEHKKDSTQVQEVMEKLGLEEPKKIEKEEQKFNDQEIKEFIQEMDS